MADFTETSGELARAAGVTQPTVQRYARDGKLEFVVASNGTRLFRTGQAERVRALKEKHLAERTQRLR